MKLIDILVRDLHKFGGWPDGAVECHRFVDEANIDFYDEKENWDGDCYLKYGAEFAREAVIKRDPGSGIRSESVTREQYEAALSASKIAWDGEGLPPVGARCEFISNDTSWGEVDVIGIDGDKVVFKPSGETYYGIAPSQRQIFRPIRSEADKKRDAAVSELVKIIGGPGGPYAEVKAAQIYDAIKSGDIVIE